MSELIEPTEYVFPPPETRQVFGPLTRTQLAVLAIGALVAVFGILRPNPTLAGVVAALGVLVVAGVVALVPAHGRLVTDWAPIVAGYLAARATGRADHRAGTTQTPMLRLPAELGRLEVLSHPRDGAAPMGVCIDRAAGCYTAVLELDPPPFLLEDLDTQQAAMARWGQVLAQLAQAGGDVHRVQWLVRTTPSDADQLHGYLAQARDGDLTSTTRVVQSYLTLLRDAGPASAARTTLLAVQIAAGTVQRAVRQAGGGDLGACTVLARAVGRVVESLAGAGIGIRRILDRRGYQGLLRVAADPAAQAHLNQLAAAHPQHGWGSEAPWPQATETRWGHYRTADRAWHRSATLVLPASPVTAHWLIPLLLDSSLHATLAMTYKPVPTVLARREVARARATLEAERHRKHAMGQLTTAEDGKRQDAATQREQELADGHAVLVYAATVTVTADSLEELERADDHLRHVTAMAGCELQTLDGQQAQGFTWTLPLCRGVE